MLQRDIFLAGEGKAWLERNRHKLGQHDPVSDLIEAQGIKPASVLEIGCADGWRLKKLVEKYGCVACGVDPAVPSVGVIWQGTAAKLPFLGSSFDLVIFGFCLYLCDPCDYFRIVAESDRVLQDGGHLIIHDFRPPYGTPYRLPYQHKEGLWSHHVSFCHFWTVHPAYRVVAGRDSDEERVTLLRKDLKGAFHDAQDRRRED